MRIRRTNGLFELLALRPRPHTLTASQRHRANQRRRRFRLAFIYLFFIFINLKKKNIAYNSLQRFYSIIYIIYLIVFIYLHHGPAKTTTQHRPYLNARSLAPLRGTTATRWSLLASICRSE